MDLDRRQNWLCLSLYCQEIWVSTKKPPDGKVVNLSSGISSTKDETLLFPNRLKGKVQNKKKKSDASNLPGQWTGVLGSRTVGGGWPDWPL